MVEKYKGIVFNFLATIPIFAVILFSDLLILPKNKVEDVIVSRFEKVISKRGKFSSSSSKMLSCYKFSTQKGFEFSTEKNSIEEDNVTIEYSFIFKSVTSVKSKNLDYTDKLISGFKGLNLLLFEFLIVASIIGLLILKFKKRISDNEFQNIILMNSFLFLILLYFWFFQN